MPNPQQQALKPILKELLYTSIASCRVGKRENRSNVMINLKFCPPSPYLFHFNPIVGSH